MHQQMQRSFASVPPRISTAPRPHAQWLCRFVLAWNVICSTQPQWDAAIIFFKLLVCAEPVWVEDLGFYEKTVLKLVARLHDQSLWGSEPLDDIPNLLFQTWCPRRDSSAYLIDHGVFDALLAVGPLTSPQDIGIVIMTAVCFESTRMQLINRTWGRHFPNLAFATDTREDAHDMRKSGGGTPFVDRIAAPSIFRQSSSVGSYMSHVYKGHVGLWRLFSRHPKLPWYGLVCDDSYVFDSFLVEFLRGASQNPADDFVCAGHLVRETKENYWGLLMSMFRRCDHFGEFGKTWVELCKEKAGMLQLPFVNTTFVHGAGIFCSNAAMRLLEPYLHTALSADVFEAYAPQFTGHVPASDQILGRCFAELGIRLVDMHGYFAGHYVPGVLHANTAQRSHLRDGLPALRLAHVTRPALWHGIREQLQFDALEYLQSVLRAALARRRNV
eukprot:TRINITY_DN37607_c0_g1_i1.p1 TRINITY_DN37607_c0_g1~~TRINITY_DN37607_c0_g1_i1.p1  ORF type:complete len:442 (-),score=32.46 TRINITY_DN37607_c0_g1_i1:202-1527(-)